MKQRTRHLLLLTAILLGSILLSGCGLLFDEEFFADRHSEAHLTKNNELQFRFKINEDVLKGLEMYKVRVTFHDERLAKAVGVEEVIYGEDEVLNGQYIETESEKEQYIHMQPLPLKEDLQIDELERMISQENAVSIEIFNEEEIYAKTYLTNFTTDL